MSTLKNRIDNLTNIIEIAAEELKHCAEVVKTIEYSNSVAQMSEDLDEQRESFEALSKMRSVHNDR